MKTQTNNNGMTLQLMQAQPIKNYTVINKNKDEVEPLMPAGVESNDESDTDTVQTNSDGVQPMYPVGANINNEAVQTNEIEPMLPTQYNGKNQ